MDDEDSQDGDLRGIGGAGACKVRARHAGTDAVGDDRQRDERTDAERLGGGGEAGSGCIVRSHIFDRHLRRGQERAAYGIAVQTRAIERPLQARKKAPRRARLAEGVEASAVSIGGDDGCKARVHAPRDRARKAFAHSADVVTPGELEEQTREAFHQPIFTAGATVAVPKPWRTCAPHCLLPRR